MEEFRRALTCVILALTAVTAAGASAQESRQPRGTLIDHVVAVVEDRPVLQSDIELEYRRMLMQEGKESVSPEEERELRRMILDGLVADLLLAVHAEKKGIEIDEEDIDSEVEQAIENTMRQAGGQEIFQRQLAREGLTLDQLRRTWREKLRARRLVFELIRSDIRREVEVTEPEIRNYYSQHIDEFDKRPETVRLAQILLIPEPSEEAKSAALERIRGYEERLRAGEDFAALAGEVSEGPSAKYGGSLGYIEIGTLGNEKFEQAVRRLSVGETSGPVLTEFGYHLIRLEDVSGEKSLVRHILVKVETTDGDVARTAALAGEIRENLAAGADFAEMAARYSDDEESAGQGGVVGDIPVTRLPPFFVEAIQDLGDGDISQVIREERGFRIVKLLGRTPERTYTYEEAREEMQRLLQNQKMQSKFEGYVEGLKGIYHVEIKETTGA